MSERRLALLEVSLQTMVRLMCNKSYLNTDCLEGFEVLDFCYFRDREVFSFKIMHESLPRVAEGTEIPHIDLPVIEEQLEQETEV